MKGIIGTFDFSSAQKCFLKESNLVYRGIDKNFLFQRKNSETIEVKAWSKQTNKLLTTIDLTACNVLSHNLSHLKEGFSITSLFFLLQTGYYPHLDNQKNFSLHMGLQGGKSKTEDFLAACKSCDLETMENLFKQDPTLISKFKKDSWTPFNSAAEG